MKISWHFLAAAICFAVSVVGTAIAPAPAADWPQWRYDAGRTAASPEVLAPELHLQWTRRLAPPRPAWPKYPRLCFDVSYEPVVLGKRMFVPSMVTDSVTALDTDSGAESWKFFADGPVRLAPVAQDGRVYFVSDDGHLYCVGADDGRLLWKFRAAAAENKDRKVLGNDRLISLCPARGGPVLAGGKIFIGSGVWPFEDVGVFALDAKTGQVVWSNGDVRRLPEALRDHSARREGGLSPQGYLAVLGDKLIVPSGRAMPGIFDCQTGALAPYGSDWGGRNLLHKGCWYVSGIGDHFFQSGDLYELATLARIQIDPANAKELGAFREPVLTPEAVYCSLPVNQQQGYRLAGVGFQRIAAWDITTPAEWITLENPQKLKFKSAVYDELWSLAGNLQVHIKSGPRLYAGGEGTVAAVEIPKQGAAPKISWQAQIDGTPSRMLSADGKLFVVTREGSLYAFGPEKGEPKTHLAAKEKPASGAGNSSQAAKDILAATDAREGYALVFGSQSGQLAAALAGQSELHVIVIDPDATRVAKLRTQLDAAGLYGTRVAVLQGDPFTLSLPPYLASLIVCLDSDAAGQASRAALGTHVFRLLRPYGGVACFAAAGEPKDPPAKLVDAARLDGAEVGRAGRFVLLRRPGPPVGSANWTHRNADAAGSLVSGDDRVRPPLGMLWFGGAIDLLFPEWDFTHTRPPTPLVAGGRMFFQVFPELHAVDIYTGRHLWSRELPGVTKNTKNRKLDYVAAEDNLYVVSGKTCYRLDAADGATLAEFGCPADEPGWQHVRVLDDSLLAAAGRTLVCMDRHSGKQRWQYRAEAQVVGLVACSQRVFCADATLAGRRGKTPQSAGRLVALDGNNGAELWRADLDIGGSSRQPLWLGYSEPADTLVAARRSFSAYRGKDGTLLWSGKVIEDAGEPMLYGDRMITQGGEAYALDSGALESQARLWPPKRRGCTRVIGGRYLISIRDAHASYYDLATGEQTFFRGIRAGCTNALIPAGGILSAPNFSHGCSCNYAVFSSFALAPLGEFPCPLHSQ